MDQPNRSETTAADGRPLCSVCGRAYDSRRIVINVATARPWRQEECQSCRQKRRIAETKKARGF